MEPKLGQIYCSVTKVFKVMFIFSLLLNVFVLRIVIKHRSYQYVPKGVLYTDSETDLNDIQHMDYQQPVSQSVKRVRFVMGDGEKVNDIRIESKSGSDFKRIEKSSDLKDKTSTGINEEYRDHLSTEGRAKNTSRTLIPDETKRRGTFQESGHEYNSINEFTVTQLSTNYNTTSYKNSAKTTVRIHTRTTQNLKFNSPTQNKQSKSTDQNNYSSSSATQNQHSNSAIQNRHSNITTRNQPNNITTQNKHSNSASQNHINSRTQLNTNITTYTNHNNSTTQNQYTKDITQNQHSKTTIHNQHIRNTTQNNRSIRSTQIKQSNETLQNKHSNIITQNKHSNSAIQNLHDNITTQSKHNKSTIQYIHSNITIQNQHSNSTTRKQHSNVTTQNKNSNSTTQKQYSTTTTQKQHNNITTQNNHSNSTTKNHMIAKIPVQYENSKKVSKLHSTTWLKFIGVNDVPDPYVRGANCSALFQGSASEQHKLRDHINSSFTPDPNLLSIPSCDHFIRERKYLMRPTSEEEATYPLAFSVQMYRDPARCERLLRAVYRPQNVYCIHVDAKASGDVYQSMGAVASCFPNVILASRRVHVDYGTMGNVEQELSCMEELWKRKEDWRYLINLTGEEFPLATNARLVRTLKSFNGTNGVHGSVAWANVDRWGNLTARPAPYNMTLTKGTKLFAVTRGYVDFVLHDHKAQVFKQWVANTGNPDETFFSSLHHNPHLGVPGSHTKLDEEKKHCPALLRFVVWTKKNYPCYGGKAHNICIFGVLDLPLLYSRTEMFVNKFHAGVQPLAYDCMEELLYNRTRQEIQNPDKTEKIKPCV